MSDDIYPDYGVELVLQIWVKHIVTDLRVGHHDGVRTAARLAALLMEAFKA